MRVAKILKATGVVENVELWDSLPAETDEYLYVETDEAGPGFTYDTGVFTPPEIEAPDPRYLIPKLVLQDRVYELDAPAGTKLNAVYDVLVADADKFGRWIHEGPNVWNNDADVLAVLTAAGLTSGEIEICTAPYDPETEII